MPFRDMSANEQGLVGVGIDITEMCNWNCPSCFAHHTPRNMSFTMFKRIVDEAVRLGFTELYVLGGEPTNHPGVLSFLNYTKDKFQAVILVTNGSRLRDRDFCQQIFETGVIVAAQRHTMEISRVTQHIEMSLTGGDHIEASHQAWENIVAIFPPERVCVQCCITRLVVDFETIFDVFRWARKMGFEPVMEFTKEGPAFKRGGILDVSPAEMHRTLERFQQIDREEFGRLEAVDFTPQAYGKTCHMLENSVHFLVDGSAVPCVGHHDVPFGSILECSLEEILENPLRQAMMRPETWIYGYCRDECELFEKCTGGCRGSAFDMSGCARASFYYCPQIPRDKLSLKEMIPPTCEGCALESMNVCKPRR